MPWSVYNSNGKLLQSLAIADDSIVEGKLDVSNAPTNGYFLQAQSGEGGGLTWATAGGDFSNGGDNGALVLGTNDSNSLTLETNNTARMVIASGGQITKPTQPAFSACVGSNKNNVTGGGAWYVIAYDTDSGGNGAWFDTGGNYNTSTYTFTATVAGVYFFAATVRLLETGTYNANNVLTEFRTTTNGSSSMMNYRFYHGDYIADVNGVMGIHWSALINLPASGTCQAVLYVAGSSNNIDVDGDTGTGMSYFSGFLLH